MDGGARRFWICVTAAAIALLATQNSFAVTREQKQCEGKEDASPTLRITSCSAAIEQSQSDKEKSDALINRGKAYDGKGDYTKAITDYTRAIELNGRYANAYYYRGLTFTQKGDIDGAKADFEKVLELNPYDARARKKLEDL